MHVLALDHRISRLTGFAAGIFLALPWGNLGIIAEGLKIAFASTFLTYAVMPLMIHLAIRMGAV
ncbi:MAG: hypothetical protein Q9M27_04000, partial [Mariprofundaceae bacterium]|nr:hypothetical protein [Mariprofundaceae bacterium]